MKTDYSLMKRFQKAVIVAGACGAVVATVIWMTMAHWWKISREATVTCEGKIVSDAGVYTSRDEEFVLVYLKKAEELYLINLPERQISMPNRSSFVILPGLVFSRHFPPVGAPMGKAEIDPKLIIGSESVEFTSLNHSRIKLGLKTP
jgi:hypothetical protein